jgi:hypothetical protein
MAHISEIKLIRAPILAKNRERYDFERWLGSQYVGSRRPEMDG